jgi:gamma-glutamylputrescine oxidase
MNDQPGATVTAAAYPPSYYAATAIGAKARPPLVADVSADVCVVGGGFAGTSAALHLAERGARVHLVEAQRIGWGSSGRNGGQIHSGFRLDQTDLESRLGKPMARELWDMSEEAKADIAARVAHHRIPCDLKRGLITAAWKRSHANELAEYANHLRTNYAYTAARALSRDEIFAMIGSSRYYGGMIDQGAGHFHPLNYVLGLATAAEEAGAVLYETTSAIELEHGLRPKVRTRRGTITCNAIILAGDAYLGDLVPELVRQVFPISVFMIATERLAQEEARSLIRDDVCVADTKFVVDYYRLSSDRRLLFGGGEVYWPNPKANGIKVVRPAMLRVFPTLSSKKIDYVWGGIVGITRNRMVHVGRIAPNIYFAQGFSGQGVALAGLTGKLMAEAVLGRPERFDLLSRFKIPAFPGGRNTRAVLQVAGMSLAGLMDRL